MLKEFKYLGLIKELQSDNYDWGKVPDTGGVYLIVYKQLNTPRFLVEGTGGWFKGKNPNALITSLKNKWISFKSTESKVLYIGKSVNLRKRIRLGIKFGKGQPVNKWGGRYIWQINCAAKLAVYFKETSTPRETEKQLIQAFKDSHGQRLPFANLQG